MTHLVQFLAITARPLIVAIAVLSLDFCVWRKRVQNIIDAIVPIIIFIAVISGIINSIREAAAKNSRPAPEKQQGVQSQQPSRAQAEIAAFLTGAQPSGDSAQRPAAQMVPQGNRKRQKQKPQKNAGVGSVQQPKKEQKQKSVGSGVSEHVNSFIGDHVKSHMGRDVDEFVNKDIGERVKSHLGSQSSQPVEMSSSDTGSNAADDLLGVLRSRAGIRHAILVNEILSRPLALRKR